ncbi:MAG TPA: NAD-dependent epimerase/dehydratase family protein [Longimicrobiaceae bacterium]|nr:NAD-dependent epimerase/dehydratase family protein [Longimicrobiaceae bacterium]
MRILFLGGTRFLGRHAVEAALARGHEVTLFTRGESGPELFPETERIRGDRTVDLSALRGRRWDAVVDTSAYLPRVARMAVDALADAAERYLFVSTLAVFRPDVPCPLSDDSPTVELEDPDAEVVEPQTYGGLKLLGERAVEAGFPGRTVVVRPGLIVGPHDTSGRFRYWLLRTAAGGEVLAPGSPERPWQFVDVRDLAGWMVRMLEDRAAGTFAAAGSYLAWTAGRVLETMREASRSGARFTWVEDRFLWEHGVPPWSGLPFWLPPPLGPWPDPHRVPADRAVAAGLTFRPLEDTVRDALEWELRHPDRATEEPVGITREHEREVLDAWRDRGS